MPRPVLEGAVYVPVPVRFELTPELVAASRTARVTVAVPSVVTLPAIMNGLAGLAVVTPVRFKAYPPLIAVVAEGC